MADYSTLATVYTGVAGVTATLLLGVLVFTEVEARRWQVRAVSKRRWSPKGQDKRPTTKPWLVVMWVYTYLIAVGALSLSLGFTLIGLWWEVGDIRLRPAIGWLAFGAAAFVITHVLWLLIRALLFTGFLPLRGTANGTTGELFRDVLLLLAFTLDLGFVVNQVMAQLGVPVFWYLG